MRKQKAGNKHEAERYVFSILSDEGLSELTQAAFRHLAREIDDLRAEIERLKQAAK